MFKKIFKQLEEAEKTVKSATTEARKVNKENKLLLAKIEAAEKRHGVLLLEDLNEATIQALQKLTDDNVVIVFTQNDNTRIEIRKQDNYDRKHNGSIK